MAFSVLDTINGWANVRRFLNRGDWLPKFGVYTIDPDESKWRAENKGTSLYLKGLVSQADKNHIHLNCTINAGMWVQFHVTQTENNLHLTFLRIETDPYEDNTGNALRCVSDRSIDTEEGHSKAKVGKREQKKVEKIRSQGGKIDSPNKDMTVLVNAIADSGVDWV
jgi:hypothetical protein